MDERTLSSTTPWTGRRIRVRVDEVERSDGHRTTREIVEHPGRSPSSPGTASGWRWCASGATPPGGCCSRSRPGRSSRASRRARRRARELAEEVGLAAATWVEGPRFYTAPGFCTELMHLYLATDLSEATADADEDEQLEPSWLTLADALAAIDDGRIIDAKTIVGIGWLARRLAAESLARRLPSRPA